MKVIKPQKIGLLHKPYTFKFKHYFVSAPVVFFEMGTQPTEPDPHNPYGVYTENLQWPLVQEQLGTQILDMVMPKPTAEFMLAGSAWNPEVDSNKPALASIKFGNVEKRLKINGNRNWHKGLMGYKLTKAEPWESVFINDQAAFGGEGYNDNPVGTGFKIEDKVVAAPNIEDEKVSIKRIGKKYPPAGFGSLTINHSQRSQYNGNYKTKDWLENHFPNLAPDTDFRLFQAAREDQHLPHYLRGDESYTLTNLVPGTAVFTGKLPGVYPRSFIQASDTSDNFKEIPLHLDTIWLFPDINVGAAIWHGQLEVSQLDARDIEANLIAYEALNDEARDITHYQEQLALRTNLDTALQAMSDEAPISPLKTPEQLAAEEAEIAQEQAAAEALQKEQQEQFLEEAKEANGGTLPPGFDMPEMEQPKVLISKEAIKRGSFNAGPMMEEVAKQKAEAEKLQAEMQQQLDEAQELSDKQLEQLEPEQLKEIKGKGNASDKIEELQSLAKGQNLDLDEEQLKILEEQQFKAQQYSITPISDWPEDEYAQEKRSIFLNALNNGELMAARNWSGADLSYLDLKGINLSQTNLENCNLEGSILDKANLTQSALLGCKVSKASFKNTQLSEANLSSAVGQYPDFSGANLTQALLMKTNFENANFTGCDMRMVVVFEANLIRSKFFASQFTKLSMVNSQCNDSDFSSITGEMFIAMNCNFNLSQFCNVKLNRCAFLESLFRVCNFSQAELEKCQFSGEGDLSGSCLTQVNAEQCGFRRIDGKYWHAPDAALNQCDLGDSDFHHGNFRGSTFIQSILSESRFIHCNFEQSNFYTALMRATLLDNCQLNMANFYRADAIEAAVFDSNFKDAENLEPIIKKRWRNADRKAA